MGDGLRIVLSIAGLLSACSVSLAARAELAPLRDLPRLDPGNTCPVEPTPQTRAVKLIVRNSLRHDVGPFSVMLPGYATNASSPDSDSYAPMRIEACRGDTLAIDLTDQLDNFYQPATNLHTHGLITPPNPDKPGPPGDYIFFEIAPGASASYRIPIPADLPGSMFGTSARQQPYPSGLYWFHAHRHTFARGQVQGGAAGVLSVGNPLRIDYRDASGGTVTQTLPANTQVKYLALRDIQLAVAHGVRPATAHGERAEWINGANGPPDYDPTACVDKNHPWFDDGACGHAGITGANATDTRDLVWLFTVNGQHFPQITETPGVPQLWRIANLSANVTYVLELAEGADPAPAPHAPTWPLLAVTLDGVVAGTHAENARDEIVGVSLRRLLLMPGSRAEIFVRPRPCAGEATLRTVGIQTGPLPQGNATGDPWPPIKLARVHTDGSACNGARPLQATGLAANDLAMRVPLRVPSLSGPAPGATGEEMLRSRLVSPNSNGAPDLKTLHPACRFLLTASGATSYRRRITFKQDTQNFMLGSEVVNQDGVPVANSQIGPEVFPDVDWGKTPHVCPVLGAQEVWELVNDTDETHNFHIHQTKFRLADAKLDRGVPAGLRTIVASGEECAAHPGTVAFCDPQGILAENMMELQAVAGGALADTWHDTIPVPPRNAMGEPGRVFVSIPFKAPEQVGRFVFHCHILEHEDNGMMAPVEVLGPANIAQQQLSEPMATMGTMPHKH
ncbi:MAG TPA: multicopper oxidase domain-containing protein [Xanthobacteraceae bacterium]